MLQLAVPRVVARLQIPQANLLRRPPCGVQSVKRHSSLATGAGLFSGSASVLGGNLPQECIVLEGVGLTYTRAPFTFVNQSDLVSRGLRLRGGRSAALRGYASVAEASAGFKLVLYSKEGK
eukprot:7179059-Pyramimonas_sp.AAC.4